MNDSESEALSLIQTAHFLYTPADFSGSQPRHAGQLQPVQKSPVSDPGPHLAMKVWLKHFLPSAFYKLRLGGSQIYLGQELGLLTSFFCRWFVVSSDLYPINAGEINLNGMNRQSRTYCLFWLGLSAAVPVICFLVVI